MRSYGQFCSIARAEPPPPVATTLVRLTEAGASLEPLVRALASWGIRLMAQPVADDEFRPEWFAYPVEEFLRDRDPAGPPATIELRTPSGPAVVEVAGGEVRPRTGSAAAPDLILTGGPQAILAVLTGKLTVAQAAGLGLEVSGDTGLLRRVLPDSAPDLAPANPS